MKEITSKEITSKEIEAVKTLIRFIGDDPEREGLKETPERFLKAWRDHWGSGYEKNPRSIMKVFKDTDLYSEMVLVRDIKVFSHCEHHIAPIVGKAHVAYIPKDGIVLGLSKLNRLVDIFARRLQVQERLTAQIANALFMELNPLGVGVVITADHFCVKTRGIQDENSRTTTSSLLGVFMDDPRVRQEFLSLCSQ